MTANSGLTKETILIVDDTPGNLAVLSDMLSDYGYRVLVATDGISALEQVKHLQPDIILLDVIMPGIDGFETCHRLKKNPVTTHIPIIFMTGLGELDNLLKGFEKGSVDYIVKPIRPAEVIARVEAQLSQHRNSQRIEQSLKQIGFSVLAFNSAGMITWISVAANKILDDCFPLDIPPNRTAEKSNLLPKTILKQILPQIKANTPQQLDIHIGSHYSGKIIPCSLTREFMLLIQKSNTEWDLASLKYSFRLTPREAEILMWISRGKTNKEMGLILDTSPRTINKHLEHIFEKLQVSTRTAAVAKVLKNNP
ncbi:MAG: response regulator [Methylococcales symbiont of Hymedesmia sp. n. MRB-2018]|nr:MAG: response regulator [Methylococcales symbiont of Hymedesmia sp. n. MRB-2018]KAF3983832.1 MAG: response regulator [Methylococcales symbiont of Hymedesmia sp. n. MRB-2018]